MIGLDWKHVRQGSSYRLTCQENFQTFSASGSYLTEWIVTIKSISIFLDQFLFLNETKVVGSKTNPILKYDLFF